MQNVSGLEERTGNREPKFQCLCQVLSKTTCTAALVQMGGPSLSLPFPAVHFRSLRGQEQDVKQGFRVMSCPTLTELNPLPVFINWNCRSRLGIVHMLEADPCLYFLHQQQV